VTSPQLVTVRRRLADLQHYPGNARRGDTEAIAESLAVNGQFRPLAVQASTSYVLTGNHTMDAAALACIHCPHTLSRHGAGDCPACEGLHTAWEIGGGDLSEIPEPAVCPGFAPYEELDVIELDVDDDAARRIVLADNRTSELGSFDMEALTELLDSLDGDLAGTGYDDDDFADLLASVNEQASEVSGNGYGPTFSDPDELPQSPAEPRTRNGDLWRLGPHRLVCGDATDPGAWERLLAGEGAQMVWTDPPYGVAVVGGDRHVVGSAARMAAGGLTVLNDDLDPAALAVLLRESLLLAREHCEPGAHWYVASPAGPLSAVFGQVLVELGVARQMLVWVKDSFVLGRGDYHYRHEFLFYGWHPGAARRAPLTDRTQDSVWEIPRPQASAEHPTMKPVQLIVRSLTNSSRPGDIVADPFAGSGSTLIACHDTGRPARLIELDPACCDVIVSRWERHTGEEAHLEAATVGAERIP
jgi:hypothetical protein